MKQSRRGFLKSTLAGIAATGLGPAIPGIAAAATPMRRLHIGTRTIEIDGRAADIYEIANPERHGPHRFTAGDAFRVRLENDLTEPTLVHWHGLTPPWRQDGVPDVTQPPIAAGDSYDYDFMLPSPGTHWMHSHFGLQEQRLLAAPLIVEDPADSGIDRQDVVVMLHDFSFRPAEEIFEALGGGHAMNDGMADTEDMEDMEDMAGMDHGGTMEGHDMSQMPGTMSHANDYDHDAYLANDRTLDDPEIVTVDRGGRIRLRIINAAASTGFHIDVTPLTAMLVAVDGHAVAPVTGRIFPLSMAQRIDLELDIPLEGGIFPVLALREEAIEQTGLFLATPNAAIRKLPGKRQAATPRLDLRLERNLVAAMPLATRTPDRRLTVDLVGGHSPYKWGLAVADASDAGPVRLEQSERVEIAIRNDTMMPHPMHLHGHSFQVIDLGDGRFSGARRDTVLVPPATTVTIAFDADNPGRWAFHCHHLYHMAAGMMTVLDYRDIA
jgi:FtsP/CotA-like multicopper oxidase with cupredoxin domain